MAGRQWKVLNVAEKNDAARELSKVMSRGRFDRREGFSKFNKIYEFDFSILGKECKMVMTSVSGHLLSLDFVPAYKNWKSCSPSSLFTAEIKRFCPENFTPIKRTLEREIRGCQALVLWTDGDREGENIAEEVVQVCTQVKRSVQIHRARFSEITPQSIMRACASLGQLDQNVSDAVKVRQEVDLRIGCAFTRFQTIRLKQVFPTVLSDQLISYGPCQFPTLGFVVERYKQVQAFIPEAFHKIKVVHETPEGRVEFSWKRVRVFNHTVCLILYQMCLESPTAYVTGIHSRQRSKWRPLPLDTVELEKQASRKLRINAKETMRIAEKLYTQGFISYPRTETNIFPESFDLAAIVRDQTTDPNWGGFATQLLARGVTPRQGTKTDNAHPPIHPTKYTNSLQEYILSESVRLCPACQSSDMVVRRKRDGGFMLSCLGYPDCRAVQFFPPCVASAQPHSSLCTNCGPPPVHCLELQFRPGSVPPAVPREMTGCTTCHHTLLHDLQFPAIRTTQPTTGSFQSTGGRGRGQRGRASSSQGGSMRGESRREQRGRARGRGRGTAGDGEWGFGGGSDEWRGGGGGGVSGSFISNTTTAVSSQPGPDNPLVCDCGEPAILLTVRKEGPNTGRQFHKCSKRDGGCNFFLWADQQTTQPPPPLSSVSQPSSSGYSSMSSNSSYSHSGPGLLSVSRRGSVKRGRGGRGKPATTVTCNCGQDAVQRMVQKEGPNKGRQFYTCSKPRDSQCGFFEWADDVPQANVRPGRVGRERGGGGGGKRKPPTCSACGQTGHTKRGCSIAKQMNS